MIRLELSWPPSVNHLYYTGEDGRRHLSKAGRAFHKTIAEECLVQLVGIVRPLPDRLTMWVWLAPNRATAQAPNGWDISNRVKVLEDALQQANVFFNDEQIDALVIVRQKPRIRGRVIVRLEPFDATRWEEEGCEG
jgi:Holliday junction resolvase RusA-like endonuclease